MHDRSAPIWDSQLQQFVGMLTITDFIQILRLILTSLTRDSCFLYFVLTFRVVHLRSQFYRSPDLTDDKFEHALEQHRILTWRQLVTQGIILSTSFFTQLNASVPFPLHDLILCKI